MSLLVRASASLNPVILCQTIYQVIKGSVPILKGGRYTYKIQEGLLVTGHGAVPKSLVDSYTHESIARAVAEASDFPIKPMSAGDSFAFR